MATGVYEPVWHDDIEKGSANDIAERMLRAGFVKKVFGLLGAQLVLTTLIGGAIVFSSAVKGFLLANSWIVVVSMIASMGLLLTFSFSQEARQKHPLNLILLFAFTAFEGVLVGAASSQYATDIVVLAFGITAAVSVGLSLYAVYTKRDFTVMGSMLFSCLLCLVIAGFVGMFVRTSAMNVALSGGGALLFSFYIIYDVQLLIGGEHQNKVSPDEYVFGAISIYLDIINLFLHILRLLNESRR